MRRAILQGRSLCTHILASLPGEERERKEREEKRKREKVDAGCSCNTQDRTHLTCRVLLKVFTNLLTNISSPLNEPDTSQKKELKDVKTLRRKWDKCKFPHCLLVSLFLLSYDIFLNLIFFCTSTRKEKRTSSTFLFFFLSFGSFF